MELPRSTFDRIRRQIYRLCGLVIVDEKAYLVHDRLEPIIHRHGWKSFEQLADRLGTSGHQGLDDEVVGAIATHETSFFRDPHVWDALRQEVLPTLLTNSVRANRPVRMWSAATSTGQEAYTLAMLVHECTNSTQELSHASCSVLATDICPKALQTAATGEYSVRELRSGVSDARQLRYFEPVHANWRARKLLRAMIAFRRLNLIEPLSSLGRFELICCRNVLIYFDEPTRKRIVEQIHSLLTEGGWLLLGAAESLYGISDRFASATLGNALLYRAL